MPEIFGLMSSSTLPMINNDGGSNDASPNKNQAMANTLLAWYWTGYYAGYEAACNNNNTKSKENG